jgi:L-seryl-tRNA(Ser) seleniumtransferase
MGANELLARIPKIDRLAGLPAVRSLIEVYGYAPVVTALRAVTAEVRGAARNGGEPFLAIADLAAWIGAQAGARLAAEARPSLRPAINATGVVLHTGLGRAVLPAAAARAVAAAAAGHSLLEIDPDTGERGDRLRHVAPLLRQLTGAEDALVVNNNAAAVSLAVAALAAGREVVIARGQLPEIGGSFRIPDVIRQAGARLVEVGATNRVRLADYAAALTPETALILRVHPSNYRIVGFTEEPPLAGLVELGARHGMAVMEDLGSGALIDLRRYGVAGEPTVGESVRAGAGVITFSGDKLLGGPQAGLVVGHAALLAPLKDHPLMRVVRCDKLALAALAATLRLYRDEAAAVHSIPTLQALTVTPQQLAGRARRLRRLARAEEFELRAERGLSQVGGGSLPGEELPTLLVVVQTATLSAAALAARLRQGDPAVFGRISRDRLLLDLRTVRDHEIPLLAAALRAVFAPDPPSTSQRARRRPAGPTAGGTPPRRG